MAAIFGPTAAGASPTGAFVSRHAPALAATLAALGILAVYAETVASIVAIWLRSETFAHGFVVVPIALWLAWQRRNELHATPAVPWYPGLALVALAGLGWFVLAMGDVIGLRQFALAFMLQAAIVTVVGLKVALVAAFPLAFLLFAVPAGEFLLPTMIDWTADFTVAALRLSGVPVYREANHFVIPSGAWSVVEACSGLRYLIASVMIGVVYAAVSYRSPWRRAAFIVASILVPILANWLRAYMIVMLGHLSQNRLAVGVDHLIYGWLFFGIVMAVLFWVGSFWSEPMPAVAAPKISTGPVVRMVPAARFFAVAVGAIAIAAIWPSLFAAVNQPRSLAQPVLAPLGAAAGFEPADPALLPDWVPSYSGHSASSRQVFTRNGMPVAVYLAYYRNQIKGRELITSTNDLVLPHTRPWIGSGRRSVDLDFAAEPAKATRLTITGEGGRLTAYSLFWVDGSVTGDKYVAKALLAWSRLRGQPGDSALIVTYAREATGSDAAREAMEGLSQSILATLSATGSRR